MARLWFLLTIVCLAIRADWQHVVSNTNFTLSQGSVYPNSDKRYLYNYDRLRLRSDYTYANLFFTFIGDGLNYWGREYVESPDFSYVKQIEPDTPFRTQSSFHDYGGGAARARLYRLYGGYDDGRNRLSLGLQNITMGVGRIWTPTNLFNPRNTYALEPDEIYGVAAAAFTKQLGQTAQISAVVSQKKDDSFKYAARYKAYLEVADVAFELIGSDDTKMAGYELEGDLGDTGVELRSEGAYIQGTLATVSGQSENANFFQGIAGGDYGFENGLTLIVEALYSSKTFGNDALFLNLNSDILPNMVGSGFYLGSSLSYTFNLFLDGALTYIESFGEPNSYFIAPSLTYNLNDFNVLSLGALIQQGPEGSEFGAYGDSYYFKYLLSF